MSAFAYVAQKAESAKITDGKWDYMGVLLFAAVILPRRRQRKLRESLNPKSCDACYFTRSELQIPGNGGFLKTQAKNGTFTSYGVSMFHQLHCLYMMEQLLSNRDAEAHAPAVDNEEHWRHCFAYLAQVRDIFALERST